MAQRRLKTGNIKDISCEVNIAAGNIYQGFNAEQVSAWFEVLAKEMGGGFPSES